MKINPIFLSHFLFIFLQGIQYFSVHASQRAEEISSTQKEVKSPSKITQPLENFLQASNFDEEQETDLPMIELKLTEQNPEREKFTSYDPLILKPYLSKSQDSGVSYTYPKHFIPEVIAAMKYHAKGKLTEDQKGIIQGLESLLPYPISSSSELEDEKPKSLFSGQDLSQDTSLNSRISIPSSPPSLPEGSKTEVSELTNNYRINFKKSPHHFSV